MTHIYIYIYDMHNTYTKTPASRYHLRATLKISAKTNLSLRNYNRGVGQRKHRKIGARDEPAFSLLILGLLGKRALPRVPLYAMPSRTLHKQHKNNTSDLVLYLFFLLGNVSSERCSFIRAKWGSNIVKLYIIYMIIYICILNTIAEPICNYIQSYV